MIFKISGQHIHCWFYILYVVLDPSISKCWSNEQILIIKWYIDLNAPESYVTYIYSLETFLVDKQNRPNFSFQCVGQVNFFYKKILRLLQNFVHQLTKCSSSHTVDMNSFKISQFEIFYYHKRVPSHCLITLVDRLRCEWTAQNSDHIRFPEKKSNKTKTE